MLFVVYSLEGLFAYWGNSVISQILEESENQKLSPFAARSKNAQRGRFLEPCSIRTQFQRDRDRILHSKAFRRLKDKTQVFIAPEGDHFRTRLTHTLEVSQIARTIARALNLNEDLTEAISLGHDIGHTPFGHTGEDVLNGILSEGFRHNEQSRHVIENLEDNGLGLNLTGDVIDGIINHRLSGTPKTLEGEIVRISDKIAYINHDIDDAVRAGILKSENLPKSAVDILGKTCRMRVNSLITDIVKCSQGMPKICMGEDTWLALNELRDFMFSNVYNILEIGHERQRIRKILYGLYEYFMKNIQELPENYPGLSEGKISRAVCDYIACMTDRYAISKFSNIYN